MKKMSLAMLMLLAAASFNALPAAANDPAGYPFFPFGFYQPYGAAYRSSIPTPPYFSLNPPVYYGTRYARPYGLSPFAAPPVTGAPAGFEARPDSQFYYPPELAQPSCNPHICSAEQLSGDPRVASRGEVRFNPYVEQSDRVARH